MGFRGRVARQFWPRRAALTPLKSPTDRWNAGPGGVSVYLAECGPSVAAEFDWVRVRTRELRSTRQSDRPCGVDRGIG